MAKLNENSFRNWNNGDTMNESDYEQERSLIITAVNANDDEVKANKTAQDGIAARVTTAEGDIDDLETRATSAENRLDSAESKNTTQDSRLTAVESKNTTQDSRLDAAEGRLNANDGKNSTQDVRLNNIETKNTEQDGRLSSAETRITNAEGRLSSAESKNGEQDSRLSGVENRTTSTESRLNTAEGRISTVETNKTDRTGDHNGTFHGLLPGQIFGPSSTQDQRYTWTATEGQTTFVLSAEAVRFPVRKESIEVVVGGAPQTDFTVPNDSQIVLSEGVPLDVKVTASWAGLFVAPSAGTDITTLDNYQTEVADKIGILSDSVDEHAETLGSLSGTVDDHTSKLADTALFKENSGLLVKNNDGVITRLLNNAQTYVVNADQFSYGFNDPLWQPGVPLITDEEGKYQINCSTFGHLMVKGIPFENTRYAGRTKNIIDPDFNQTFEFPPDYASADWAKWCVENKNGFGGFKPKPDLSDVMVGDILFFSWSNPSWWTPFHNEVFMKIDHDATVARKNNDGSIDVYEVGNNNPQFAHYTKELLSQDVVYACRMPFNNIDLNIENIIINGDTPHTATGTYLVNTYSLTKPLKPQKWHTAVIKGTINTDKCFFSIRCGNTTLASGSLHGIREDGLYTYQFTTGSLDISAGTINIIIGSKPEDNILDSAKNGTVDWFVVTEGYTESIKEYVPGKITKNLTFTINSIYTGFHNVYYSDKFAMLNIRITNPNTIADNALVDLGTITGGVLKTNVNVPCTTMEILSASPSYANGVTAWVQSDVTPYRLRLRNGATANRQYLDICCMIPI